jgi:hypothetical protein
MEYLACGACERVKPIKKFRKNNTSICLCCEKLNLKYHNEIGQSHKKCIMCHNIKPMCTFYLRTCKTRKSHSNNQICRSCKQSTSLSNKRKNNVTYYAKNIYQNLKRRIKYHNKKNPSNPIIFDINLTDILDKYYTQFGYCLETDKLMTFVHCDIRQMPILYPDNMTVRIYDNSVGYVNENIYLACLVGISEPKNETKH